MADLFREGKARRLWESLPEQHRHDHFDTSNMSPDYAHAFRTRVIDKDKGWYTQLQPVDR
ncbi:hypothetical protein ACQPYK_29110 [Streptosporangium sp. CA-135522]|uniref:hypothetical protein n=1 Tax=Streptosporangium sp. CA-135522 TaxID=3240072 RepID=UPI003D925461